jgi:DNA-binding MurR/RpiR family transcriptional regulator
MSIYGYPDDVGSLSWLAELLGVSKTTVYRLASTDQLKDFGVFRVGAQYRVAKARALREVRGSDPVPAAVSR